MIVIDSFGSEFQQFSGFFMLFRDCKKDFGDFFEDCWDFSTILTSFDFFNEGISRIIEIFGIFGTEFQRISGFSMVIRDY